MPLRYAARTDPGLRRSTNEDSFCARPDLGLYIVADGMGGHVAGEIASRVAVEEVARFVAATVAAGHADTWPVPFDPALGRNGNRLKAGLLEANGRITSQIDRNGELRGMATTAVALLADAGPTALAHVGDSRAYLWRGGVLTRLTRDHSWVEEQMRAGMLSAEAAREHPWRNIVTRALSGGTAPEVDVAELALETGDRVLLCSDGLTAVLTDAEIAATLGDAPSLEAACEALIQQANAAGGPDNTTVVVVEQVEADAG